MTTAVGAPVRVIATAGHVDHGKSTLVQALTGTDPDRLAEEKARGLTIDLGFAAATLPSGAVASFVDVPGHSRFLKNMLAGVGGVSACTFVVAATEGWKPQSEEHLRILELLGVRHGVVALTKVGLLDDPDDVELARLEVVEHLQGSFLDGAEVVEVDAPTGRGLAGLRLALDRLVAATPASPDRGRARLWVDRAFTIKGSGTVVTGTLTDGTLAVDDEVEVLPQGRTARVRGLQSLHRSVARAAPGTRVAVNLAGVEHREVARGDVVVAPGRWHATARVDAELHVLASLDHAVSRRGAHVLHVGAREVAVRVRVLGREALAPGGVGAVRLHLPVALPLVPGDRFVLRDWGRDETVGGGTVLDVDPVLPASRAAPDRRVERVVAERGWVDASLLERLVGQPQAPDVGRWRVSGEALAAARAEVAGLVDAAGPRGLDVVALDERHRALVERMGADGDLAVAGGRARRPGPAADAGSPSSALAHHPWLEALRAAPFQPPPPEGVDPAEVRELVRAGLVVKVGPTWFATDAVEAAAALVAGLLAVAPEGVGVADVREALGSSRKFVVPLLEHLDATGRTRRRGDLRIAGPRLPAPPPTTPPT